MSIVFQCLTLVSELISKRTDAVLAMFVVSIIFMMILPLPTWLVDVLIALNISISALIMVLALYLPGPLAFSTFPAFLLITTLFRMALSVTTTRLILLQGDAGEIVETFGNFVVGGNLVVGLVIFLILIIVNFLVITKGSERVAEVSARFTLDAMPGKQMSIDSDLRSGLLSGEEAREKRKSLAKESQLFGAMDGAMKFVKGDAIAGIIIVLVNIIGGFSIGVLQQGLPSSEAIRLYSILTIGDGLVAQIPSLLIALSAGMIITRVKDDVLDQKNVGQEMSQQLVSEPKAWLIASSVLVSFAMVPGMPTMSFLFLGLIVFSIGWVKIYLAKSLKTFEESTEENQIAIEQGDSDANSFDTFEQISMSMHASHEDSPIFDQVLKVVRKKRNDVVVNSGFILPRLSYKATEKIEQDVFVLRFYEVPAVICTINASVVAVKVDYRDELEGLSIQYASGLVQREEEDYLWVDIDEGKRLLENNIPITSCFDLLGKKVKRAFLKEGYQFVGIDDAKKIANWIEQESPELKKELERVVPLTQLSEIIKNLLQESVSLKSLRKIIETIITSAESERDTRMLTEHVRIALKEQICAQVSEDKKMNICLLEPEIEEYLRDAFRQTASGGFFAITKEESEALVNNIIESVKSTQKSQSSIALVVAQDIRPYVRSLISNDIFELPVLSFSELSQNLQITPIARVSL